MANVFLKATVKGNLYIYSIYRHAATATPSIVNNGYYSFGLPFRSSADHASFQIKETP
jgi:hypothetical protein